MIKEAFEGFFSSFWNTLTGLFRNVFVGIFKVLGFILVFVLIVLAIGYFADKQPKNLSVVKQFYPKLLPNAEGVREVENDDVPIILKMDINGVIGIKKMDASTLSAKLVESREGLLKDRVKGMIICFDTPGGTVGDSARMYQMLKDYKERYKVPIYGYVEDVCASGGMYIACSCDKIYTNDTSVLGSIGVLSNPFFNVSQFLKNYSVESLTLTAGKDKDALNPFRPWKEGEEKSLQDLINYYYNTFVSVVTTNRPNVNKNNLVNDYGARVFDPPKAEDVGLIDGFGYTYEDVLEMLVKELGEDVKKYQVVELEPKMTFYNIFEDYYSILTKNKWSELFEISGLPPELKNQVLYLYDPQRG